MRISIYVEVHITSDALDEFSERVVRRHIAQGEPVHTLTILAGESGRAFAWTDGILDIDSVFISIDSERILEVALLEEPGQDVLPHPGRTMREAAQDFVDFDFLVRRARDHQGA